MAARITPTPGITADGWVSLGVMAKAHGLRGAIRVHVWHDDTSVLHEGVEIKAGERAYRVKHFASGILELVDVNDRTGAEGLQGQELFVRREDFGPVEGEIYLVDLVGLAVIDVTGKALGTVAGFSDNGAQPLLEVKTVNEAVVLVPFVPAFVKSTDGRVVLDPPAGLFDDDAIVDEGAT